MEIIEYNDFYNEDVKSLLVELQEYIVGLDREKYNVLTEDYREEYFKKTIQEVKENEGRIYLALENNKVIGLIVGLINNEEEDTYDFKAPKRGRITELVVSRGCQSKGVGQLLLNKMEDYFKSVNCQGVLLSVFEYNEKAKNFYNKNGYFNRNIELMKKI